MIELGNTLKAAREAKGLSIADIANKTHMMSTLVADLENEDFSRLPAPIYGRGFIKLYCEVVGIDPKPLIAEFNEICIGNREPAIRERVVTPPAEQKTETLPTPEPELPVTPPQPEPIEAPEPPVLKEPDLFSTPTKPVAEPVAEPAVPPPEQSEAEPVRWSHEQVLSRYAAPLRDGAAALQGIAPSVIRWSIVAVALALVVWCVAAGIRALYRATGNSAGSDDAPTAEIAPPKTAAADKDAAKAPDVRKPVVKTSRKPVDVPPLYID